MPKIKIIYSVAGGPDTEAEVDVQSLQHSARDHLVLDHAAGRRLVELFGNGYGDRHFTLVDGDMAFDGCRVVKMGADCTISYMHVGPYAAPAPVRVVTPKT